MPPPKKKNLDIIYERSLISYIIKVRVMIFLILDCFEPNIHFEEKICMLYLINHAVYTCDFLRKKFGENHF